MSGSDKRQMICWDSCILIAWFNEEPDKALDLIGATLKSVADNKINLLLSAVSFAEVLDVAGENRVGAAFEGFVKRPNTVLANVDERVGRIARDIRQAACVALNAGEISKGVKSPDAMIVATAVLYRAEELYTYDPVLREIGTKTWPILRGLKILRPEDISPGPLFSE